MRDNKKLYDNGIWEWFKEIVQELRQFNTELIKEQGGGNQIMISISMVDHSIDDWVEVNPHSIDLRSGIEKYGQKKDIKHLLFFKRRS
ncbi:MAG: hypothetical protein KAX31_04620 [Thermoplasmata archaeon]|nr:hypothetical protein [Thermoplasmata archaeon]